MKPINMMRFHRDWSQCNYLWNLCPSYLLVNLCTCEYRLGCECVRMCIVNAMSCKTEIVHVRWLTESMSQCHWENVLLKENKNTSERISPESTDISIRPCMCMFVYGYKVLETFSRIFIRQPIRDSNVTCTHSFSFPLFVFLMSLSRVRSKQIKKNTFRCL